jgi:Lrp/AsnC family transcriptional regulator, regulator for asnA, asnC and gidA
MVYGCPMSDFPLDDLDRAIVAALEQDGRRPYRDVARQLSVSEATIRTRVRNLEEAGVLRIVAFANPLRVRNALIAVMLIRVDAAHHDEVVANLAARAEISYVSTMLGSADICAQVVVRDQIELADLVRREVRALPGVLAVDTNLETEVHKLRFANLDQTGSREKRRGK